MRYLNLGCGSRYHPEWINIDMNGTGPDVLAHDLRRGIPLPDSHCDVVYHSALLEHMRREDALLLMKECYRVMRPGGILRVAVPDLERICRVYLNKLTAALAGDPSDSKDYEWIMLEMYDQTVRERSGGEMLEYLRQDPIPNVDFVYERIGSEGRRIVQRLRETRGPGLHLEAGHVAMRAGAIREVLWETVRKMRNRLGAACLGGKRFHALRIGQFRLSGEIHHWMYDRYSLSQLMLAAGFEDPRVQTALESLIPNWGEFALDTSPEGEVIKPDSLFMEAVKPQTPGQ